MPRYKDLCIIPVHGPKIIIKLKKSNKDQKKTQAIKIVVPLHIGGWCSACLHRWLVLCPLTLVISAMPVQIGGQLCAPLHLRSVQCLLTLVVSSMSPYIGGQCNARFHWWSVMCPFRPFHTGRIMICSPGDLSADPPLSRAERAGPLSLCRAEWTQPALLYAL